MSRRHLLARRARRRRDRLLSLVVLVEEVTLFTQRQTRGDEARVEVVTYANDAHITVVQPPRLVRLSTLVRSMRATA